jgi:hypothetical protein
MLIDGTYFHDEIVIPFLVKSGTTTGVDALLESVTSKSVNNFIRKHESLFLEKLLGKELRDAFLEGLSVEPPAEKWLNLKNILVDETEKTSPIANYVYYRFKRNESTITTGLGEVLPTQSGGTGVDASQKMANAYNDMCDRVNDFYRVFNWVDYREYLGNKTGLDRDIAQRINIWNL